MISIVGDAYQVSHAKLKAIHEYDRRGWAITPTHAKKPSRKGWQSERLGLEEVAEIIGQDPSCNIGVLLGEPSGWLVDIDLDHPLAIELAANFLPTTESVFGRATKPRSHWLYYVTAPVKTQRRQLSDGMIVELRSTGCQTVFPGSIHPSGEPIEWDSDGDPATVSPEELAAAVSRLADAVRDKLGIPRQNTALPRVTGHNHRDYDASLHEAVDTAMAALSVLDPSMAYDDWVKVGMALHSVDESLSREWDCWSRGSDKYCSGECATKWKSFRAGEGITLATLCKLADDTGHQWRPTNGKMLARGSRVSFDQLATGNSTAASLDLKLMTSADFCRTNFSRHFLVQGILVQGQHGVIGGPPKSLKTGLMVDMAISLGTGTPFLGQAYFNCPERVRTCILSGESGGFTLQETARRICHARGCVLEDADVLWGLNLPQLANPAHLVFLEQVIHENGIRVLMIDPAYLCLLSGDPQGRNPTNVFAMGSLLKDLGEMAQRANCTLLISHHTRKAGRDNKFAPASLEDLTMSGFPEWARQWLLISRRAEFEDGTHQLLLDVGGSAGHSGKYWLTIHEGLANEAGDTRKWDVAVTTASEGRSQREDAREKTKQQRFADDVDRIRRMLRNAAKPLAKTRIRDESGINSKSFEPAFASLLASGEVISGQYVGENNRTYTGYRLAGGAAGQPDN